MGIATSSQGLRFNVMEQYWHEIAIGAVSLIILLAGVVWGSVTKRMDNLAKWIGEMSSSFTEHTADDSRRFEAVMEKMNSNHLETIDRINGRWSDRSDSDHRR